MIRDVLSWLCVKQETIHIQFHFKSSLRSLASLPEELYHHVILRVFVLASPSDHLSLLLVSKTWNAIGRRAPLTLRPNKFLPLALRRGFPKLGFLDLSNACEVHDERLPCLVGFENLVALKLKRCREVTDNGLTELHPLTQLQWLNLARCNRITDSGLELLCRNLVNLRLLNIKHCYGLTSNGFTELSSLKNLTNLNCSGCQGLRYEALDAIGRVISLKVLKMNECPLALGTGIDPLLKLSNLVALLLRMEDPIESNGDAFLQVRTVNQLNQSIVGSRTSLITSMDYSD